MATDYDAPRKTDEELAEDSLEELKARRADKSSSAVDVDEAELAESLELPGADLSDESLTVRVLPRQSRRVHLQLVLPRAAPQPARPRGQERPDLQGMRVARTRRVSRPRFSPIRLTMR